MNCMQSGYAVLLSVTAVVSRWSGGRRSGLVCGVVEGGGSGTDDESTMLWAVVVARRSGGTRTSGDAEWLKAEQSKAERWNAEWLGKDAEWLNGVVDGKVVDDRVVDNWTVEWWK
ncbi:hypothetical protein PIB30_094114, partial [Stylosanthes scabra]|nr:hypothetical protein [Stylosanthes scabra]